LIFLNYNEHGRSEVAKIVGIDYYKLELYELQSTINSLLNLNPKEISEVNHDLYESAYDPYCRVWFGFKICEVAMGINYPFPNTKDYSKLSNSQRNQIFEKKFKNLEKFLKMVLEQVNSNSFKLVVMENLEDIDSNDYTEAISGSKDDILFYIGKQKIIMNKELLNNKMKKYWL